VSDFAAIKNAQGIFAAFDQNLSENRQQLRVFAG